MRVERLSTKSTGLEGVLERLERRWSIEDYIDRVKPIVDDVASRCYEAVKEYSCRFDGVCYDDPLIPGSELYMYEEMLGPQLLSAIDVIIESVRGYFESIKPSTAESGKVKTLWLPVESAALYVPGGRNPYPSTAIMTVTPASVAGVKEIHVLTPPRRGGVKADPATVVAAYRAGASSVYAVGGPQAIAGVAYGCKPLPRVDMIAGPGGAYVQAAKALVASRVGIDMIAGPTELFVIAFNADPSRVALEALAQAEHGPSSTIIVASPDGGLLDSVREELEMLAGGREDLAVVYLVETESIEEALELADRFAPEHLLVLGAEPSRIPSAGIVSVGVPAAYLDYAAGPSHVLPTNRAARWRGGLSVYDFLRPVAMVDGMDRRLLEAARVMAEYEGFIFHKRSLEV